MEGKASIMAEFVGISAFPILIDSKDPDIFVETILRIASGFGAIQLEDVAAPECFEIEEKLSEKINKPVFLDDQHVTAVISLAALKNANKITGRKKENCSVLMLGAGAAAPRRTHRTPMISRVHSFVLQGIDAVGCEIEADLSPVGLPRTTVVGLPDIAVKESMERVRTAVLNSGFRSGASDQSRTGRSKRSVYDLPFRAQRLADSAAGMMRGRRQGPPQRPPRPG
jgi:hypothetical protein